jgi:hypothetical protein
MEKEKVYITRDENCSMDLIWVWRQPPKGNWIPTKMDDCDGIVVWQGDINYADAYHADDFKEKFGKTLEKKTKKCVHLKKELLDSKDKKVFNDVKGSK